MIKSKFPVKTSNPFLYEILKQNALNMRNNPTQAEEIAWELLRNNKIGAKFRRQHIIGDYIVDFVNLETGLILELDGEYHDDSVQKKKDEVRSEFLIKLGYTIIRFKNEEVICGTDSFLSKVEEALNSLRNKYEIK